MHQTQQLATEAEARHRAEEARTQEAQKRTRTVRNALVAVTTLLIVTVVSGAIAFNFLYDGIKRDRAQIRIGQAEEHKKAGRIKEAVAQLEFAASTDPELMPPERLATEMGDVYRQAATQLVQQGETMSRAAQDADSAELRQQAVISATTLFSQALALDPPPDTPVYVWIPPGDFTMGSSDQDISAQDDEKPPHPVTVNGFWIMRTEVTNAQYKRCVDAHACSEPLSPSWQDQEHTQEPVSWISWTQAQTYANWVGGRLPTEAEWEKACRGTDGRIYPWGGAAPLPEMLNYWESAKGSKTPVGDYPNGASFYELYDMAGNVWEWTADWYDENYYASSPSANPMGPANGTERVLRGGSWDRSFDARDIRCTNRGWYNVKDQVHDFGLRVVISGN